LPDERSERLYDDLAWLWPIMSPPADYVEEAELFARLMREHSRAEPRTLLHLTSGGGHVDHRLSREFRITGIDASPSMVELARKLNPDVEYVVDDVRTARLGRTFDAVFIDDGVLYMLTEQALKSVFVTASEHLYAGGVMLVYVEATPETFEQNSTRVTARSSRGIDLVYIENEYDPDTSDTTFETTFVYLIRREGDLTVETDRHTCGIFPLDTWRLLLREAGFDVAETAFEHSELPDGRREPIFLCTKR